MASDSPEKTGRRRFLKHIGGVSAALATKELWLLPAVGQENLPRNNPGSVPRRLFGRTGVEVSILGVGGHTMAMAKSEVEGIRIIHEAMDAGVNFMDNAWEYHDGRSEEWTGKALTGGDVRRRFS